MTDTKIRPEGLHIVNTPPITEIDLIARNAKSTPVQVCRTCVFRDNRKWQQNEDFSDCDPLTYHSTLKLLATTEKNRVVPVDRVTPHRTQAFIDTCGHGIRPECTGCGRFDGEIVGIPYTADPEDEILWQTVEKGYKKVREPFSKKGNQIRWWNVAIGGKCTIPAEGFERNGETIFCDPIERQRKVDNPSCANCYYLDYTGDHWQSDHLTVNRNATLSPYEREVAIRLGRAQDWSEAQSIGIALWKKQTTPIGRRIWYKAYIIDREVISNVLVYTLRFDGSASKIRLEAGDTRFEIYELDNPDEVAVEVGYPWFRMLRLPEGKKRWTYNWPEINEVPTVPNPEYFNRVDAMCSTSTDPMSCDLERGLPCNFHVKLPRREAVSREIVFDDPGAINTLFVQEAPNNRKLSLTIEDDRVVVVDGNGNKPVPYSEDEGGWPTDEYANASIFRIWLRDLLATAEKLYGKKGKDDVRHQYLACMSKLRVVSKQVTVRHSWLSDSGDEANKPNCSHPGGLNLRKVFQDAFGSERADWDFDTGPMTMMEVEESIRVGSRQHSLTQQRLQEEMIATETSHPRYSDVIGGILPSPEAADFDSIDFTVIEIEGIGGMKREDGTPVTDPAEFMDRLDQEVIVGDAAKRAVQVRQQLFGYSMSTGFYGSRGGGTKTTIPALDPDYVVFGLTEEELADKANEDNWICPDCDKSYEQSQIEDFFRPICDSCGSALYRIHSTRSAFNSRAAGGIGNAMFAASPRMQERQRLESTICPNWRLKAGNTYITLDDITSPGTFKSLRDERPGAMAASAVKVFKVGTLTEDQKRSNREYDALLAEVMAEREEWIKEHPGTSAVDVQRKFPSPAGIIYQEKAVGSAAKSGGAAGIVD